MSNPALAQATDVDKRAAARRWWALAVLSLSLLIIMIDHSVVNVALPTIIRDLDAKASQQQWIINAYTLVFAGLLLTTGTIGDRWGRRGALMAGLLVFALGSVVAATAGSPGQVIAGRAVTGVGAALVMPSTLSILTATFTARGEFARAIGIWAGIAGAGGAIAPTLGGWVVVQWGWQGVFWVNLPIVAVAMAGVILLVRPSRAASAPKLDPIGTLLSFAGLGLLLWSVTGAPERGWLAPGTLVAGGGAVALLGLFAFWGMRHEDAMLDVRIFANNRLGSSILAVGIAFMVLGSAMYFFTQYMQFGLGFSPLRAGAGVLPVAAAIALSGPAGMSLGQRFGLRTITLTGLLLMALGLSTQAVLTRDTYLPACVGMVIAGVGLGMATASATGAIVLSLPPARAGLAGALNNLTHEVFAALGIGVFGSLLAFGYRNSIADFLAGLTLPAGGRDLAGDNIGGALNVAQTLPGTESAQLASAARDSFLTSMHVAQWIGAALVLLCMLAAARLPRVLTMPGGAGHAAPHGTAPAAADAPAAAQPSSGWTLHQRVAALHHGSVPGDGDSASLHQRFAALHHGEAVGEDAATLHQRFAALHHGEAVGEDQATLHQRFAALHHGEVVGQDQATLHQRFAALHHGEVLGDGASTPAPAPNGDSVPAHLRALEQLAALYNQQPPARHENHAPDTD